MTNHDASESIKRDETQTLLSQLDKSRMIQWSKKLGVDGETFGLIAGEIFMGGAEFGAEYPDVLNVNDDNFFAQMGKTMKAFMEFMAQPPNPTDQSD